MLSTLFFIFFTHALGAGNGLRRDPGQVPPRPSPSQLQDGPESGRTADTARRTKPERSESRKPCPCLSLTSLLTFNCTQAPIMSSETATVAEAHQQARKEAKRLALRIFRRRRTILKAVDRFHKKFGLRAYVHLEKHSRYGSFDAYSSGDKLHAAIVSRAPHVRGSPLTTSGQIIPHSQSLHAGQYRDAMEDARRGREAYVNFLCIWGHGLCVRATMMRSFGHVVGFLCSEAVTLRNEWRLLFSAPLR